MQVRHFWWFSNNMHRSHWIRWLFWSFWNSVKGFTCKVSHCDRQEDKSHIFSRRPFIYASSAFKEPIDHGEMTILTHFWPRYQITTLGSKSFIFWHTWIMDDRKSELKTVNKVWMHINFFPFFTVDGVYEILLWPFNEFPILFQRWLIIHSEFFNMWNLRWPPKCHISIQFFGRCRFLNNQRKHRPQEIGTSFVTIVKLRKDNCQILHAFDNGQIEVVK